MALEEGPDAQEVRVQVILRRPRQLVLREVRCTRPVTAQKTARRPLMRLQPGEGPIRRLPLPRLVPATGQLRQGGGAHPLDVTSPPDRPIFRLDAAERFQDRYGQI